MTTTLENDLKLVGESTHPGGQFRDIAVIGKVRVDGDVVCRTFSCVGKAQVRGALKSGTLSCMGETAVGGAVDTGSFSVMGQVRCDAAVRVRTLNCMGKLRIQGQLDAEKVKLVGELAVKGDCNVDDFNSRGAFTIDGLLSVDHLQVQPYGACRAAEIGGARLEVRRRGGFLANLPLADWCRDHLFGGHGSRLEVQSMEGDDISLEDTTAALVRGARIRIGRGCRVEVVEYREAYACDADGYVGQARQV